jgi:hypothetical protein
MLQDLPYMKVLPEWRIRKLGCEACPMFMRHERTGEGCCTSPSSEVLDIACVEFCVIHPRPSKKYSKKVKEKHHER